MPYLGNPHIVGDSVNNFKVLDDISTYTATFDGSASSVVNPSTETIKIVDHRFVNGQRVTYNNGGGSNIGGLTSGTAYYVIYDTAHTIKLATDASNAASLTAINLNAASGGTSHTLNAAFDGVNKKFRVTHGSGNRPRFHHATQLSIAINNVVQRPNNDANNFTEGYAVEVRDIIVFKTAPTVDDIFFGSLTGETRATFDITNHKIDNYTGDGSTTLYNLSQNVPNNESLLVTLNGVVQHPTTQGTTRSYTLVGGTTNKIQFTTAPALGVEIQIRHLGFSGASSGDVSGFYGRTGNVGLTSTDHITTGDITSRNINASGIITASSFSGGFSGNIVGTSATFTGNLSVGGVLTYEDVTNIDSVGIITARKDIHVGAGISAVGIITGQFLMASGGSDANKQNVKIGWMQTENLSTGGYNVLVGRRAGEDVDTGSNLVLIGNNAGQKLTNQTASVLIGGAAGNNLTGDGNVIIGRVAAQYSTSASSNVIIGTYAGIDSQGDENTIVGYYAGRGTSGNTDGTRNTFIGTKAGFKIRGGDDNTSLGRNSLVELLGGNKNVAIGQQAGDALVSGNNNIIIGYQADASTSSTSNEITLGDSNINHLRIPGIGCSISEDGAVISGIVTATTFSGSGASLTNLNASNIASGTVPTARLGSGTANNTTFLRGDSTFQTVNTDLVSDTSPQLGGTLDGNGQTANFTANNTGLGIPIGTDANEPSAGSYKGYIRFNDDDDIIYYSDGTNWKKISSVNAVLSSISGNIFVGSTTNLTLTGTGFLSANLVVNFVQSSDGINTNVTVTPTNDTSATVAVPAAVYNNVSSGNAVTIKVTNSDGSTSATVNVTALTLPSGGSIYTSGGYRYHKFTSSGTFTQTLSRTVEYLIVAGGGAGGGSSSGGNRLGGGGGAGGLRGGSVSTTPQGYTITIGAGGSGVTSNTGNPGSSSSAFGVTSIGGGGGGSGDSGSKTGGNGGSGGGAGRGSTGGSGTSGQGNDGGDAVGNNNPQTQGGGGGAGGAGTNGGNNGSGGNTGYGGVGSNAYSAWASATSSGHSGYYAGGGGSGWHGSYTPTTRALGGNGGGGNGGDSSSDNSNAYGIPGTANTGGGGGGNSTTSPHNAVSGAPNGPAGGSGIVIIRYQL